MAWGQDEAGRAALQVAHAAVVDGAGVAVIGESGLGRTTLVRAVGAELDPARFAPLYILATEAAGALPFGAFAALLPVEPSATGPAGAYHQIASELQRRAGRRTPVLIIDDAHTLDGPSAGMLPALVTNHVARIVVTTRATAAAPDAVRALWKDRHLARLDLRPLDREGIRAALRDLVEGAVAESAVARLAYWTSGNPFALRELVGFGLRSGSMHRIGELWWWQADLVVPPVLTELIDRRLDQLSVAERDLVDAVALGQPLSLDVVERIAPGLVESLEDQQLLCTAEEEDRVHVRVAQPLLRTIVRRRISPARRTRIATVLLTAAGSAADVAEPFLGPTARASWQPDFRTTAPVEDLLTAAEQRVCADPALAKHLATAAWHRSRTTQAAVALAGALTECGELEQARTMLEAARHQATTAEERLLAAGELASHRCWVRRDPHGAAADLDELAATVTSVDSVLEVRSLRTLVLLFGGRPAQALAAAEEVLSDAGTGPYVDSPAALRATLRARLTRSCALTLVGRTEDAAAAAAELAADVQDPVPGLPYLYGMIQASRALAHLWRDPDPAVPATHPVSGRWPLAGPDDRPGSTPWMLFDGYVRRVRGDRPGAIRLLREALVQQSEGECLFRSEASAWLSICLAEDGQLSQARAVLDKSPPDEIALVPGLRSWAEGALAAASGDEAAASELLVDAADRARRVGARLVEAGYLMQLAGLGGSPAAGDRLAEVVREVDAPRLMVAAEAALALVKPDGTWLLEHVGKLTSAGLRRHALGVAEVVAGRPGHGSDHRHHAASAVRRLRSELGLAAPPPAAEGLTARESEVAVLAADGMSDRDISARLFISVRTVESHLARVYRKLDITSRRRLSETLRAGDRA